MKLLKKAMSFTLALLMVVSMLPLSAAATEVTDEAQESTPSTCSVSGCEKEANHEGACTVDCTTSGCTKKNGHEGEHAIPQTHAEGCTLGQTHEGDCIVCDGTAACPATANHKTGCLKVATPDAQTLSTENGGEEGEGNVDGNDADNAPQNPCNGRADCTADEHAATCLTNCDETSICDAKTHKETCKYYLDLQEEINDMLDTIDSYREDGLHLTNPTGYTQALSLLDAFLEEYEVTLNATQQETYDAINNPGTAPLVSPEDAAASITVDSTTTYYETLQDAVNAAGASATTIELADGIHTLSAASGKNITLKGSAKAVIEMYSAVTASDSTVAFEGVTVKFDNDNYEGLQHAKQITYTGCKIYGTQFMYAPTVVFTDCTFEKYDAKTEYNVWTYGSTNVTFTGCTFNTGGKAILVYVEGEIHATINVNDCTFNDDNTLNTVKAAVEVGASKNSTATTYKLKLNDCTVNGFAENNEGTPTGSKLWGNKDSMDPDHLNVVIDGEDVTTPKINVSINGSSKPVTPDNAVEKAVTDGAPIVVSDPDDIDVLVAAAEKNTSVTPAKPVEIKLPAAASETAKIATDAVTAVASSSKVELTVPVSGGAEVTFSPAAIDAIAAAAASAPEVELEVKDTTKTATNLPDDLTKVAAVYDITLTAGSSDIHELNGTATVTLPNTTGKTNFIVYYLDGDTLERKPTTVTTEDIIFTTDHFSTYIVDTGKTTVAGVSYATLQEAIDAAASSGDTIQIVSPITDESVTVSGKTLTITGDDTKPLMKNVKITATRDAKLTVNALKFEGDSYIQNSSDGVSVGTNAAAITVTNCVANVTPSANNHAEQVFINLGTAQGGSLDLTVTGNTIVMPQTDDTTAIYGWAYVDDVTIRDNTITAGRGIKLLAFGPNAEVAISDNTINATKRAIDFYQNSSRENMYTATLSGNTVTGTDTMLKVETASGVAGSARVNIASGNTVKGSAVTSDNVTVSGNVCANTTNGGYVGFDVKTDASGKVNGGKLMAYNEDTLADEISKETDGDGNLIVEKLPVIATIDDQEFTSLQAAIDAAGSGDIIQLQDDVALTDGLEIANDDNIILDLNGKTISYASSETTGNAAITNNGALTISDSDSGGKITYHSSAPSAGSSYSTNTITNCGTLTVVKGTIENTTDGGSSNAIDNNTTNRSTTLNVQGGTITAEKVAVRLFVNPNPAELNITNGSITGAYAVQAHLASGTAPAVDMNISGGTLTGTDTAYPFAIYSWAESNVPQNNVDIDIEDGTFNGDIAMGGGGNNTDVESLTITGGNFKGEVSTYDNVDDIEISGGKFAKPVDSKYTKDGFAPVQNADGTYGVAELPADVDDITKATVDKTITIKWVDDKDAMDRRPSKVVVALYGNSKFIDDHTLRPDDPDTGIWTLELDDLPAYTTPDADSDDLPQRIIYTVKSDAVKDYITTHDKDDTFDITNTIDIAYSVTNGANQTIVIGSAPSFTTDATGDEVLRVLIDGKEVDEDNYTVNSKNNKVTLKAAFVKKLGKGEYDLTIEYQYGSASTTFKVKKPTAYSYDPDKLMQTGQLNWPIPVMAVLGTAALAAGVWFLLESKKKHYEN